MKTDNDRTKIISQKWIQFAAKRHDQEKPGPVTADMAITYVLKANNTYDEFQYNNMLKITGKWKFADNEKKLLFMVTSLNVKDMPVFEGKPTTIILKLTSDTLIIGNEAYYGKDAVYGHDDQYFVKAK